MLAKQHTYTATAAELTDTSAIAKLLLHYSKMGNLLPRTQHDIEKHLANFYVIKEHDGEVIACGALEHFTDELAEVRSLVVHPDQHSKGLGKILVSQLIELAKERKAERLMALTYSAGFFEKLGFKIVEKEIFPEKIWGVCINCYKFSNCDETAVLLQL